MEDNKADAACEALRRSFPLIRQGWIKSVNALTLKGEQSMRRLAFSCAFAVVAWAMLVVGLSPRVAAQDSGITGTILDVQGKPWENLPVAIVSDQGTKLET